MFILQKTYLITFALSLMSLFISAQVTDSTYMSMLKTELKLDSIQWVKVDSIYATASIELRNTDKEVQSLSRKSIPQEEKDRMMSELTEHKKNIRQNRESNLLLLLTADQSKIYFEKIKPSKPSVLHMGMNHDRINCNVCVKN